MVLFIGGPWVLCVFELLSISYLFKLILISTFTAVKIPVNSQFTIPHPAELFIGFRRFKSLQYPPGIFMISLAVAVGHFAPGTAHPSRVVHPPRSVLCQA
jgi:hypothetical protein